MTDSLTPQVIKWQFLVQMIGTLKIYCNYQLTLMNWVTLCKITLVDLYVAVMP